MWNKERKSSNILVSQRNLEFTIKVTEQKLIEDITSSDGYGADNILIGVYSATLDEDQIDVDESKDSMNEDEGKTFFTPCRKS